jgi:hypothetical protein
MPEAKGRFSGHAKNTHQQNNQQLVFGLSGFYFFNKFKVFIDSRLFFD